MMGLVALQEVTPEGPTPFCLTKKSSCESTSHGRPLQVKEERPQNETHLGDALILDFPASRAVRNKFLFSKPPTLWYFAMQPGLIHTLYL